MPIMGIFVSLTNEILRLNGVLQFSFNPGVLARDDVGTNFKYELDFDHRFQYELHPSLTRRVMIRFGVMHFKPW